MVNLKYPYYIHLSNWTTSDNGLFHGLKCIFHRTPDATVWDYDPHSPRSSLGRWTMGSWAQESVWSHPAEGELRESMGCSTRVSHPRDANPSGGGWFYLPCAPPSTPALILFYSLIGFHALSFPIGGVGIYYPLSGRGMTIDFLCAAPSLIAPGLKRSSAEDHHSTKG
jgi:hypothetical protein